MADADIQVHTPNEAGRPEKLIAGWAGIQVLWISSALLLPDTIDRVIPEAWLYPALANVVIAVTGPIVGLALLRRPLPVTWLLTLCWLAAGTFVRITEIAVVLEVDAPNNFFGGNEAVAVAVVTVSAIGNLVALVTLASLPVRRTYVGPADDGQPLDRFSRWVVIALVVWVIIQTGRLIAVPLIGDVLNDEADPAWLGPAIGDVIVAVASPWLAWSLWRWRRPWVWVTTVVYLVISIVDHLDTISGSTRVEAPPTFEDVGFPAWLAPLSQTIIDVLFLALILLPAIRSRYFQPRDQAPIASDEPA